MKKNGFVSTSLIYTFFIIFLSMMVFLLNSYSRTRYLMDEIKYDIKNNFAMYSSGDVNIYFMVWDNFTKEYELKREMPLVGYSYLEDFSYCKNESEISFVNGKIIVEGSGKDSCYAYFKGSGHDIDLKIYIKETADSEPVLSNGIPGISYDYTSSSCEKGTELEFDKETRTFKAEAIENDICEVVFTKNNAYVEMHYFAEDEIGLHSYNGFVYKEIMDIPSAGYHFDSYLCSNNIVDTNISETEDGLKVESSGENICNVYYNKGENKVNIVLMEETEDGLSGYTTGKKYSRVFSIPSSTYQYVGSICTPDTIKMNYKDGKLIPTYDVVGDCYAYFDLANTNVVINYYLQNSTGDYDIVTEIPTSGYVYNSEKSICGKSSSKIVPASNYVTINSLEDDVCNIYFDEVRND